MRISRKKSWNQVPLGDGNRAITRAERIRNRFTAGCVLCPCSIDEVLVLVPAYGQMGLPPPHSVCAFFQGEAFVSQSLKLPATKTIFASGALILNSISFEAPVICASWTDPCFFIFPHADIFATSSIRNPASLVSESPLFDAPQKDSSRGCRLFEDTADVSISPK